MGDQELQQLLEACKNDDRIAQKKLYKHYYAYGMSIALRYSKNKEEAQEIFNDSFMKVFTRLDRYTLNLSFPGWVRRIIINSAIDYYRHFKKHAHHLEVIPNTIEVASEALLKCDAKELEYLVQMLSPNYRLVFNLYAIEGYTHKEISQLLGISEGTSKSNLSRARAKLKKYFYQHQEHVKQNHI